MTIEERSVLTHHSSGVVSLGQDIIVDRSRVPEYEIARISADLYLLAALGLEPINIFLREAMPVCRTPCVAVLHGMSLEEQFVELARFLEDYQSTIFWTVRCQVQYALNTLHAFAQRTYK